MVYRRNLGALGASFQPTVQSFSIPASVRGINAESSVAQMAPDECIYTYDIVPSEYGLRLRQGYREWANGLPSAANTILPYIGESTDDSLDELWAVCAEGIYDITNDGETSPTQLVSFSDQTLDAGFGVFVEYTNDASEHYLQYADGVNGLHQYSQTTGLWSVPAVTGAAPFDVANVAFVANWKNRLWYVLKDSSDAWYLPPEASAGTVTKFTFGAKFERGGDLRGLWNWTIDGGDGVDDYLIAVSRGGDVLIYRGSDPSQPDFGLVGSYFIGEVPRSRRVAMKFGGELYLLSVFGITSIRDLLQGRDNLSSNVGPSSKIARLLRADVQAGKEEYNWSMLVHPGDGFLQVVTPYTQQLDAVQYVQNIVTQAWGMWSNVPVHAAASWNERYYFSDTNGSVFVHEGTVDGSLIDGTVGEPITFRTLTSFQAPDSHAQFKRVGLIRASGLVAGVASIDLEAIYDYSIEELLIPPSEALTNQAGTFDVSLWDVGTWDYSSEARSTIKGSFGMGRSIAIGMSGSSDVRITVLAWDVMYTRGGYL